MNAASATTAAPNWAEITTEPHCPLCDYMLRGLTTPRCPECGYTFEWAEVLDASKRDHPYLFEHHPERNVWSYFKTVFGAMRPRRFWSQLHPAQYGSSRRLIVYWIAGLLGFSAAYLVVPTIQILIMIALQRNFGYNRHNRFPQPPFWEEAWRYISRSLTNRRAFTTLCVPLFLVALWPWVTYLALQVFRVSMRKARVKSMHVLRCVIYSIDASLLACLLIIECVVDMFRYVIIYVLGRPSGMPTTDVVVKGFAIAAMVLQTYRLSVAYRRYLRFDHPVGVAVSAQIITFLVMAILVAGLTIR